jgi:retron-type reverse transcriptase
VGPATTKRKTRKPDSLYDRTKSIGRLWEAWGAVYENALASGSTQNREKAKEYAANARVRIAAIGRKLAREEFVFQPQTGVLIEKKAKGTKRPVVIAPIDSRIVQRAILDTLQEIPAIRSSLIRGLNFGGVPGKGYGVPGAIIKALEAVQTKPYYIRTDIKSFFTRVPRDRAVSIILNQISDDRFAKLVRNAVTTELADAEKYGEDQKLFPIADIGVAQGSCLSPLLCNLMLDEFDQEMNGRSVVTVRYIDDFLILAKDKKSAFAAYRSAGVLLAKFGLDAYNPILPADEEKAAHGHAKTGIKFLGCEVRPDRVRPSRENWRGLVNKLDTLFDESAKLLNNPAEAQRKHLTYAETTIRASKTVQGWANTFGFCTDDQLMNSVDVEVTNAFAKYNRRVRLIVARHAPIDQRKALGVFAIQDRVSPPERAKAQGIIFSGASGTGT